MTDATLPASTEIKTACESRATFDFQTSADERRFGNDQRHALALHVRTHERAVRVIVFEERNQTRRDRNELLRRDVHVVNFFRFHFEEVTTVTHRDFFLREMTFAIHGRVRLRDEEVLLPITGEVIDFFGHAAFRHLAVRRFDEAEFIDSRERRHRADETDVRTFRRFDRTNASVMRRMNVADFETRAIA